MKERNNHELCGRNNNKITISYDGNQVILCWSCVRRNWNFSLLLHQRKLCCCFSSEFNVIFFLILNFAFNALSYQIRCLCNYEKHTLM